MPDQPDKPIVFNGVPIVPDADPPEDGYVPAGWLADWQRRITDHPQGKDA